VGGSGIGLTIARQIAQAHGGTLVLAEREAGALFILRV
jgi:signal transduction histidine kinase